MLNTHLSIGSIKNKKNKILDFTFYYFCEVLLTNISCKAGLLPTNALIFVWETVYFRSHLKDNISGLRILGRCFPCWPLNLSLHSLPVYLVSGEKSERIPVLYFLYIRNTGCEVFLDFSSCFLFSAIIYLS